MGYLLLALVFKQAEVFAIEPGDEAIQRIRDGNWDQHQGALHTNIAPGRIGLGIPLCAGDDFYLGIGFRGWFVGGRY